MTNTREFFIAGVQHHDLNKVIANVEVGTMLTLIPEPTNKYDPNAIKIEYLGTMIGYVPKKFSADIAAEIEIDPEDVKCTVIHMDKKAKPWEMCKVMIYSASDEAEPEDVDFPDDDEEEEGQ